MQVTSRDTLWYLAAYKLASESQCKSRHGCVIVKSGRPMSLATNRAVSHPIANRYEKASIHAEQRAIAKSRTSLVGATLYSARSHTSPTSSPCIMCRQLIKDAGIKHIVYSDGKFLIKERIG